MDVTQYTYKSKKLPKEFEGFKVVQVSDLHDSVFGEKQSELLYETEKLSPDVIVVTGDVIDRNRTENLESSMQYIQQAVGVAPVYYVPGNHEKRAGIYPLLRERLIKAGVILLENQKLALVRGQGKITLAGMMDPFFFLPQDEKEPDNSLALFTQTLQKLLPQTEDGEFRMLLCHRPELFSLYTQCHIDFTFTGHAHGGQFRLPLIGPLYSPMQGIFPKYTSGIYQKGEYAMVVSRGLGNSVFPIRIGNSFELLSVTFQKEK